MTSKDSNGAQDTVVLSLSAIEPPKKLVVIDGKSYALANRATLGFREYARMANLQQTAFSFEGKDAEELTDDDIMAAEHAISELTRIALPDAPEDVLEALPPADKLRVVRVFTVAVYHVAGDLEEVRQEIEETASSTGETSLPASSGSTGSRRRSSSSKRRSSSSKP